MSSPLPEDVRHAIAAGNKIEAIRRLRGHTGLGLADAKAAVESGQLPGASGPVDRPAGLPPEASAALAAGDKVRAIKLLRAQRQLGLREAKNLVDGVGRANGPMHRPGDRSGLPAGVVPVLLAGLGALGWYFLRGR